jgi:hypothetical protein
VRIAVAAVVAVLAAGWFLTRGGDNTVGTAGAPTPTPSVTTSSSGPGPAPAATISSSTPTPTRTARPPTLAFTVRYPAYITVRVPGGRTLVSKLYKSGAKAEFDQKVLEVVNGRPQAVRFVVNGTPRRPGPSGQVETFTVRRR